MDPRMLLVSFILSRLGAGAEHGRYSALQRSINDLLSPARLTSETQSLFDAIRRSPFYSNLQSQSIAGTNTLSNNLQRSFAMRGLNTSGLAATTLPLARSSIGPMLGGIDADLFSKALSAARANLGERANWLEKTGTGQSIGGLTVGNFLRDYGPALRDMIFKKSSGGTGSNLLKYMQSILP